VLGHSWEEALSLAHVVSALNAKSKAARWAIVGCVGLLRDTHVRGTGLRPATVGTESKALLPESLRATLQYLDFQSVLAAREGDGTSMLCRKCWLTSAHAQLPHIHAGYESVGLLSHIHNFHTYTQDMKVADFRIHMQNMEPRNTKGGGFVLH